MSTLPEKGLQIRTLIKPEGELELSLAEVEIPTPGPTDIIIKVEATPINPSDLGLLVGAGDISTAVQSGTADRPVITAKVPEAGMRAMKARIGESLPVGNEGAGTVVAAGESEAAQALLGKRVTGLGGEFYAEYRMLNVAQVMELPDGISAEQGASCYVNPLTALSFVETMRNMGHESLVHTAAASNLGQMLNKICLKDGVPLVNIVRKEEQAEILRGIGAKHIVNSTSPTFMEDLIAALMETGATLGFDAIGGGPLAGQLLIAMEAAASRKMKEYSRYGSGQETQVFIYGRLDMSPTLVPPGVGFAWNLSGYLLTPFLQKAGKEVRARMYKRVIDELTTTFASHYTKRISLAEALNLDTLKAYDAKATGEKYLITPNA
ncbi:zinc-binding dehydrogenase [Hyphomonas atlantica]|uniref:NADH oxidase n=1 Tax=Hyphomonas atlantica TaxID=1280948 RepID=A0A059DYH5_9PROT|nr:zinc-binding dehydrogenase [Hyphomonas atlantica]KCZ58658.1 NADH oxidase [Hyphomonas atlantica]HAE94272.1 NADH oxidase [Hyphomonas atlantica]HBF91569.1 NADH oxidase [Hyphomonas atlantica]HBH45494.1 NADH oxidase [Hyphomonas atlantica]HBQ47716.1 NADH oxidase [Hyphomonas atlantica]|tara:strand:- start:2483 stop:3619 length:1137 start_codon:yes stop_codon:yes gene_type:complete